MLWRLQSLRHTLPCKTTLNTCNVCCACLCLQYKVDIVFNGHVSSYSIAIAAWRTDPSGAAACKQYCAVCP
jgi:hypothetical protein